jgi:DNA-binding transcriptional ArsR family regulator
MKSEAFAAPDAEHLEDLAEVFAALAHPVRLRIVLGLASGDCCVGSMVECLGLPQALVSRHLAILREAGVVRVEVEGRKRRYHIAHRAVPALVRSIDKSTLERSS